MSKEKYINQRIKELVSKCIILKEEIDSSAKDYKDYGDAIKKALTDNEKLDIAKKLKFKDSVNAMKFLDVEKVLPIITELVKLSKIQGIELELEDKEKDFIDENCNYEPLFIVDAFSSSFKSKDIENMLKYRAENPNEEDKKVLLAIIEKLTDGKE